MNDSHDPSRRFSQTLPTMDVQDQLGFSIPTTIRNPQTRLKKEGLMLIDPASSTSCVFDTVLEDLKCKSGPPHYRYTAEAILEQTATYMVDITFISIPEEPFEGVLVGAIDPRAQDAGGWVIGTIGRDILDKCVLRIDGPNRTMDLDVRPKAAN